MLCVLFGPSRARQVLARRKGWLFQWRARYSLSLPADDEPLSEVVTYLSLAPTVTERKKMDLFSSVLAVPHLTAPPLQLASVFLPLLANT